MREQRKKTVKEQKRLCINHGNKKGEIYFRKEPNKHRASDGENNEDSIAITKRRQIGEREIMQRQRIRIKNIGKKLTGNIQRNGKKL